MSDMISHGMTGHSKGNENECSICLSAERDKLKAELKESHKAFDVLEEQFLKLSSLLTEAGMKNKSLYEQFSLWKEEAKDRDLWKAKAERLKIALEEVAYQIYQAKYREAHRIIDDALSEFEAK